MEATRWVSHSEIFEDCFKQAAHHIGSWLATEDPYFLDLAEKEAADYIECVREDVQRCAYLFGKLDSSVLQWAYFEGQAVFRSLLVDDEKHSLRLRDEHLIDHWEDWLKINQEVLEEESDKVQKLLG